MNDIIVFSVLIFVFAIVGLLTEIGLEAVITEFKIKKMEKKLNEKVQNNL